MTPPARPSAESRIEALADHLHAAWAAGDPTVRARLLSECCAPRVRYANPLGEAIGVAALTDLIGRCLAPYPGHRPTRTSAVDLHHGRARWEWGLRDGIGQVVLMGLDVVTLAEAAPDHQRDAPRGPLLATVSTFFGPPPPRIRTHVFGAVHG
ncbi:conserved hypothetical protein [Frankia canadensis]|uniref:SnoaL-like domain-containing protein n=1 Tax=Frankia canadensis TaxID=1836972 RepID=A0A2I2KYA7_9ACTN|nr:hypothetical protein [Frankia canadensis]SNQ50636.1 conserved hypothetical protein [Frankia canadensis]SOU57926.1 conserved hypothetical protein [Frankia canadensis]